MIAHHSPDAAPLVVPSPTRRRYFVLVRGSLRYWTTSDRAAKATTSPIGLLRLLTDDDVAAAAHPDREGRNQAS